MLASRIIPAGLIEALAAPHGVERYVQAIAPGYPGGEVRGEVFGVQRRTERSLTLRIAPNRNWRGFQAGQYVSVSVEIDGVRHARCYSPASSQHVWGGELELTIRAHEHGLVSRHLRANARAGMTLGLSQAAGEFVLPIPRPARLLLISGGSGITPVTSMLRTLCDEGHRAPVVFLHYARYESENPYRSELGELARRHCNIRVYDISTRSTQGRLHGHLTRRQLHAIDRRYREAEAYVCGPSPLIDAVGALWTHDGAHQRVHSESFKPAQPAACTQPDGATVRFAASGVEAPATDATLLEQAERAGLTPAYGCRMGICHTCTTRKLAGQVHDINSGRLSAAEPQDVQLCVSTPVGDVELDL